MHVIRGDFDSLPRIGRRDVHFATGIGREARNDQQGRGKEGQPKRDTVPLSRRSERAG